MRNNGFLASILRGVSILLNPIINKILIQKTHKSRCFHKKQRLFAFYTEGFSLQLREASLAILEKRLVQ